MVGYGQASVIGNILPLGKLVVSRADKSMVGNSSSETVGVVLGSELQEINSAAEKTTARNDVVKRSMYIFLKRVKVKEIS